MKLIAELGLHGRCLSEVGANWRIFTIFIFRCYRDFKLRNLFIFRVPLKWLLCLALFLSHCACLKEFCVVFSHNVFGLFQNVITRIFLSCLDDCFLCGFLLGRFFDFDVAEVGWWGGYHHQVLVVAFSCRCVIPGRFFILNDYHIGAVVMIVRFAQLR